MPRSPPSRTASSSPSRRWSSRRTRCRRRARICCRPAGTSPSLVSVPRQVAAAPRPPTLRDEWITGRGRLADVYGQWDALLAGQERTLLHDCLSRVAIVLAALLALLFANRWLERLLGRAPIDRRQLGTLRSVVGVALQILGVVLIVLVVVGVPGQLGTMVGIAAAGDSTRQAEQEWRRTARGQSGAAFSAQPGIAVRPAPGGVEIALRYVTRASERFALRARLYQSAVQLLAQHPRA